MPPHRVPADAAKADWTIDDPGDGGGIQPGYGVCALVTAGAETRTLGDPETVGQRLVIVADDVTAGSAVVTADTTFDGTNNVATFDAAGEMLDLVSVRVADALVWRIVENVGSVGLA